MLPLASLVTLALGLAAAANSVAARPVYTPWEECYKNSRPNDTSVIDHVAATEGRRWALRWAAPGDVFLQPFRMNCVFRSRLAPNVAVPFAVYRGLDGQPGSTNVPFRERGSPRYTGKDTGAVQIEIRNVLMSDSGKYTCVSYVNGASIGPKTVILRVHKKRMSKKTRARNRRLRKNKKHQ